MTIVVTGAGSGGHITPILAVAHELKRTQPDCKIIYIGQKGDSLSDIPQKSEDIDHVYTISAGKLRRYSNTGFKQILDISTNLKNLRDVFKVIAGTFQSYKLLGKIKPDAIFIKGGFIGVPVGLSAAARHIPYITHDSDGVPGLANRIIARWAKIHTTALPKEYYNYSEENTVMVGVPISTDYKPVDAKQRKEYKDEIKLGEYKQVLLITGGGLGAVTINELTLKLLPPLLNQHKDLAVVHFVGRANEDQVRGQYDSVLDASAKERVRVETFVQDFYRYSGAADLIVSRAGATNLAEFATQGKACVIIPSPYLVNGHQLKNAHALSEKGAIKVVSEDEARTNNLILLQTVSNLLDDKEERKKLSTALSAFASSDATKKLAVILLNLNKVPQQ